MSHGGEGSHDEAEELFRPFLRGGGPVIVIAEGRSGGPVLAVSLGYEQAEVVPAHPSVSLVITEQRVTAVARQSAGRPAARLWDVPRVGLQIEVGDGGRLLLTSRSAADALAFLPASEDSAASFLSELARTSIRGRRG